MTELAHAPTGGPSGAARRVQCPASVKMEAAQGPEEETEESREGTAAHWAVSEQLAGRLVDAGQVAPNGVPLTLEMMQGADLMSDDVAKALQPYGLKPTQGRIETRVAIPRIHPLHFGTPDYSILLARPGQPHLLLLWDYKFGHRFVSQYDNLQMVEYIAGLTEGLPECDIVVTIVQPRSYSREGPVRRWETKLSKIQAHITKCAVAAGEAMGDQPRARVGPECRDCRARHACPTLQDVGYAGMDESKRVTPLDLPPAAAALELAYLQDSIERLKARASGLEAQLEKALRTGGAVPGWALQPGESRESWTVPAAQVIALGKMLHLDLAKPAEAITPNQARQKGLDPNMVKQIAQRPPAAMKLVRDDGAMARRVFG